MEGRLEGCEFGVLRVMIEAVDRSTVTFGARSGSRNGDPNERLLRSFTVPLTEIYTAPIPGAPEPVELSAGKTGNLFLSRVGWNTLSADGFGLFGRELAVFKWPVCGAAPSRVLSSLTVIPARIVVHGVLEHETEFFELDLLGPDVEESQEISWHGAACIDVRLTPAGAARLRVKARATTVKLWPTQIVVQGSPWIDRTVVGEVDVLDLELAGESQHLAFETPGDPIVLSLTQDGVNAFHVTPQAVAEHAADANVASSRSCAARR